MMELQNFQSEDGDCVKFVYGYEGMEHWSFSARASAQTGRVIKPRP